MTVSLAPGVRLGSYEVTAKIGSGGMGEVYQARDTTLDRDVALKVLPDAFTSDPDRLARFEREAKVLASLNHPNIGHIYGLEEAAGTKALVLELVEGPTLADRIAEGPIPIDEALPIAKQIAEALEAAHEQGIIHRDLKPANVKVKADGTVKVLDFGLAKAFQPETSGASASESPTITVAATQQGVILGTAAYLSPEAASGKPVDKRADIWSFGVVLFEMLTGRRAFDGETVSHVLAAVLKSEPDLAGVPTETPRAIRRLLRRCLMKERRQRIPDIGMARLEIHDGQAAPAGEASADAVADAPQPVWQRARPLLAGALLLVALTGMTVWALVRPESALPAPITRFSIPQAEGELAREGRRGMLVAVSPDGVNVAYATDSQIFLRSLDRFGATPIIGTDVRGPAGPNPFFSPNGRWIGFLGDTLYKVPVGGGAPVALIDLPGYAAGGRWEVDGTILFGQRFSGIWRVSAAGGAPHQLISIEEGEEVEGPQLLPRGEWVLFTLLPRQAAGWDQAQIVAQSLVTDERRVLIASGRDARYVRTGDLVYALGGAIHAVGFDPDTPEVTTAGVMLVDGLAEIARWHFDVSDTGTLVYVPVSHESGTGHELGWVTRDGQMTPLTDAFDANGNPRLSPDETQIVLQHGPSRDLWLYDIERENRTMLIEGVSPYPVWSPNGTRIAFYRRDDPSSSQTTIYSIAADRSGEPELMLSGSGGGPTSWSPDGSTIVLNEGGDIWTLGLDGTTSAFLATEASEWAARVSPDGQWMAYVSDESGEDRIYAQPFPDGGRRITLSTSTGTEPVWSRDGTELFYRNGRKMMAVGWESGVVLEEAVELFEGYDVDDDNTSANYDVAGDGRFLMSRSASPRGIAVVQDWFEELKERVPVP